MSALSFETLLEQLREKGSPTLSPARIASRFALQTQELAALAGVHRNTLLTHPEAPRVQQCLRDLMRLLSATIEIQPDVDRAIFFVKNTPIPSLRHKTAFQLASEGRIDDVVEYLSSIASGFSG